MPSFRCAWCGTPDLQVTRRGYVIFHHPDCPCLIEERAAVPIGIDALDALEAAGELIADYTPVTHMGKLDPYPEPGHNYD